METAATTSTPATITDTTNKTDESIKQGTQSAEGEPQTPQDDGFSEWESKIDSLPPERSEAVIRKLLKKSPMKTKSGDKEFVVDDYDKLKRSASLERHFTEIGTKLKQEREQLESQRALVEKFSNGDESVMRELLGKQPALLQSMAKVLHEKYEQEQKYAGMTPEQRSLAQQNESMKAELESIRQEREQQLAAARQMEEQRLYEATEQEVQQSLISILEAGKVPKSLAPVMLRRLAPIVEQHMALDTPLQPQQLADLVKEQVFEEQRMLLGQLDGEELLSMVSDDVARKIGKAYLARVRGSQQAQPQQAKRQEPKPKDDDDLATRDPIRYARLRYGMTE
jgi:hypothetical protein